MSISNKILINSSKINYIKIDCDLYSQNQSIKIYTTSPKAADELIKLAATIGAIFTQPKYREGITIYLHTNDLNNAGDLFTLLKDHHFISIDTRQALSESIKKIDEIFANRSHVDDSISELQKTVILNNASHYFRCLLGYTNNYHDMILVLACALKRGPEVAEHCWQSWILGQDSVRSFDITNSGNWMRALAELLQGRAGWTSALMMQIGPSIPNQAILRQIIIEGIIKAFEEKYGKPQLSAFEAFYLERALELLKRGNSHKKSISMSYRIPWYSAFPTVRTDSYESDHEKFIPTEFEEQLLKKYGLKRFPKSQEDMALASMGHESDPVIKDHKILRMEIDGELYPNARPEEQLECAIQDDESEEMLRILPQVSWDIDEPFSGLTALGMACYYNAVKSAKKLIELGADVNAVDQTTGWTCLHVAAHNNHLASIRLLLEKGALFQTDGMGRTPLHLLFDQYSRPKLTVQEMVEAIELFRKEWEPTRINAFDLFRKECLPTGIDAFCDQEGNNCLNIASLKPHREGVLALLQLGASLEIQDDDGLFPYERIFLRFDPLRKDPELYHAMVGFLPDILLQRLDALEGLIQNESEAVEDVEAHLTQLTWFYENHAENPVDLIYQQTAAMYRKFENSAFIDPEFGRKAFLNQFSGDQAWLNASPQEQLAVINRIKVRILLSGVRIAIEQGKIEDLRRHLDQLEKVPLHILPLELLLDIPLEHFPFHENPRHRLHYLIFDEYLKGCYPEPEKTAHPDFGRVALAHYDGFHIPDQVKLKALKRLDEELAQNIGS